MCFILIFFYCLYIIIKICINKKNLKSGVVTCKHVINITSNVSTLTKYVYFAQICVPYHKLPKHVQLWSLNLFNSIFSRYEKMYVYLCSSLQRFRFIAWQKHITTLNARFLFLDHAITDWIIELVLTITVANDWAWFTYLSVVPAINPVFGRLWMHITHNTLDFYKTCLLDWLMILICPFCILYLFLKNVKEVYFVSLFVRK